MMQHVAIRCCRLSPWTDLALTGPHVRFTPNADILEFDSRNIACWRQSLIQLVLLVVQRSCLSHCSSSETVYCPLSLFKTKTLSPASFTYIVTSSQPSRPSPFNASSHLVHSVLGLWTKRSYSHFCIYFPLGGFIARLEPSALRQLRNIVRNPSRLCPWMRLTASIADHQ